VELVGRTERALKLLQSRRHGLTKSLNPKLVSSSLNGNQEDRGSVRIFSVALVEVPPLSLEPD
ncbi:hypothetical protein AMECASPLE_022644, partial [Ameca splendens]